LTGVGILAAATLLLFVRETLQAPEERSPTASPPPTPAEATR
jgi:hypothetical protein